MKNDYSFKIVKNPSGTYCIKEYRNGKPNTFRSPFSTVEEARQKEFDILTIDYGYKESEIKEIYDK